MPASAVKDVREEKFGTSQTSEKSYWVTIVISRPNPNFLLQAFTFSLFAGFFFRKRERKKRGERKEGSLFRRYADDSQRSSLLW